MIDANGNLIKTSIPSDAPSVCIEDFCGYTAVGHFPLSFAADYFPQQGIVRFTGEWWNVPDMPCDSEPSELDVNRWARKHGAEYTYVPDVG